MSDDDSIFLDKLLQSIADGDPIDWDEVDKLPADEELRQLLRQLRLVADVADLHRSRVDDDPPAAEEVSTKPPSASSPRPQAGGRRPLPSGEDSREHLGRWGHLLLLRKIGEGAFGEVYHAHDTWLDHPVALKLLRPQISGTVSPSRILHEARRLARVRHPNVVTVHGADKYDGRVGFWMDFIEGQTLAELVAEGRLSAGEAGHIGQEVCRALAAVHEAKLIHRDVKAQNVMRASDGGRIILMDFGAGEFMDSSPLRTRVRGTPLYLAPELFADGVACVQTDIYAVGVLLYYLVTGSFPVHAQSVEALAEAHRSGARRPLRDSRPDLPDAFAAIVERALDPNPARRHPSAGELLIALAELTAPVLVPRVDGGRQERTALQQLGRLALLAGGIVATTEAFGFLASRTFELTLQVDPEFAAGPVQYFAIGTSALIPFVAYWIFGAAFFGVLAGLRLLFRSPLERVWTPWSARVSSIEPTALATVILVLGIAGWAWITWTFADLFAAIDSLFRDPSSAGDLSILSPAARGLHRSHGELSAALSFVLGLAAWRWLPRVEKRLEEPSTIRWIRWAIVAVAFIVVGSPVMHRRLVWDEFEVVVFENQRAFVIGTSNEELLLYAPTAEGRPHWRVQRDAPGLRRTGITSELFEEPGKQE